MKLDDRRAVMFADTWTGSGRPRWIDAAGAGAVGAGRRQGVDGDGLLTMEKILGLKLDADWVVLSACNTAAAAGAAARTPFRGSVVHSSRAGARALLVTNWPVETTLARALTTAVFRREGADSSLPRAEALRQAMMSVMDSPGAVDMDSGRTPYSYAHPIFWAPFSLVGDGSIRELAANRVS